MRKRNKQIKIWMNEEEYKLLEELVNETGDTKQGVILKALQGITVMTDEQLQDIKKLNQMFADYLIQVRGIANNTNQIAAKANTLGYKSDYKRLYKMKEQIELIKEEGDKIWELLRWLTSLQNRRKL